MRTSALSRLPSGMDSVPVARSIVMPVNCMDWAGPIVFRLFILKPSCDATSMKVSLACAAAASVGATVNVGVVDVNDD